MQSPVLERLVGGAVLVGLLLLLALVIGPREGARMPDEGGSEIPVAEAAPELSESGATAFPGEPGADDERVSSPEWGGLNPVPGSETEPAGRWAVQVGSFSSRANADRLSGWCRENGFGARVVAGKEGDRNLYRVRVGPFASREDARSAVAELALLGRSGFVSDWEDAAP